MKQQQDITQTRRWLEAYNTETLSKVCGSDTMKSTMAPEMKEKLEKYLKGKNGPVIDPLSGKSIGGDYEWTPCRFSSVGWKYQPSGTKNRFLMHPNKRNNIGYSP